MSVLVCGSVAYDNIMVFDDRFRNHIFPEQIHILNVSFMVPKMRRQYGGCAANIVYGLNLLGCEAHAMATVGKDFSPYAQWLDEQGISRKYLRVIEDEHTAQAFIITDMDDNQIIAFHPGAMNRCHVNTVPEDSDIRIGLISPEGREGMICHAEQFSELGIPLFFDPGQGLSMFDSEELDMFIDRAGWIACNDYEAQVLCQRTGATLEQLARRVRALIVTLGSKGSIIYHPGGVVEIPVVKPDAVRDPTGCGDAYRAGLLYGLVNNLDWETTGRIASLMGAFKIEYSGGQGYAFELSAFSNRYEKAFKHSPGIGI